MLVAISGPKKVSFSGLTPNGPRNGYCLYQNHYVNNSIIWRLDLMILMRANPLLDYWKTLNIETFLGHEMATSKASYLGPKKSFFKKLILFLLGFSSIVVKFYAAHPVSNIFLVCHLGPKKSFGPVRSLSVSFFIEKEPHSSQE